MATVIADAARLPVIFMRMMKRSRRVSEWRITEKKFSRKAMLPTGMWVNR